MQNRKLSIRKIVSYLNNEESDGGGFWLPNIQRPFVWSEEQITKLFDSIMREYPISTLLAWKTKEDVKQRKFIDCYYRGIKLTNFYVPENKKTKTMVLDGQQRLQSLFIGLKGSYEKKELFFNVLSGSETVAPEDIKYLFAFKKEALWPWVKFKDIISSNKLALQIAKDIAKKSHENLNNAQEELLQLNIAKAVQEFVHADNITYQELDSIESPEIYQLDDIVEIFIRANSGGTKLGKSDLLFSLLTSSWEDADGEMESLLEELNSDGFKFDRDFILKTCLTVLGKGSRYEVNKFRDGKTKEEIISQWDKLTDAIKSIKDFITSKTYIRSNKAIPSYLALIPLIYYRYHYKDKFSANKDLSEYLLRVLITGVFGGSPDNLIDKIVRNIKEKNDFVLSEIYGVIRDDGRSLEIVPDVIFREGYETKSIHLFFNLWYKDFNYNPVFSGNIPSIDHIFPQSLLKKIKVVNPETGKNNLMRYNKQLRDQIANCMLLAIEENGKGGKSDILPEQWFSKERFTSNEEHKAYLELHLIPDDPELWKIDRFDDFIEERKKLILRKFHNILRSEEV